MSVTKDQAAALYAAVFNRAPDQNGLNFWTAQDNFVAMSEGFVTHPVFTEQYGELSNEEFVKAIYENVLQGQGDAEGIEFWVNALDNGVSRGEFLAEFIDAALAYDGDDADALLRKAALENKVAVGLYFTEKMGAASNLAADVDPSSADVVNDPAYKAAAEAIANVTSDPATVEAAKAEIDKNVPLDNSAIAQAAEVYQEKLDAKADAEKARVEAAKAADKALDLGNVEEDTEDANVNVTAIVDAVNEKVNDAKDDLQGEGRIDSNLEVTEQTIANTRESLTADLKAAQANVDALKKQDASAVALQEKLAAYDKTAEEINATVAKYVGAAAEFAALNDEGKLAGDFATPTDLGNAKDFKFTINFDGDKAAELTVVNGKIKVGGENAKDFNELKGVEAYKEQVLALHGNIAKQEAAEKAVGTAALAALRDKKYFAFDEEGKKASWALVTVKDGQLDFSAPATQVGLAGEDGKITGDSITGDLFTLSQIEDSTFGAIEVNAAESALADSNLPESITNKAEASADFVDVASQAEKALTAFDKAVDTYNTALEQQQLLKDAAAAVTAAEKAIETAEKAFEDLGVQLVKVENGTATGEVYNEDDADLFVYDAKPADINNFDGKDLFYFGDKAAKLGGVFTAEEFAKEGFKFGGDNSVLEIFAVQEEANTVLYVEKSAFAGSSSVAANANTDLVKITLTGVQAEDLAFNDGFLHF